MITAKADVMVFEEPDRVYQFVALDFMANYPRWSPEVVSLEALSAGPVRTGFQARQVRVDQGHKSETVFEVTELVPLKRICFKGVSAPYRSLYEFDDRSLSTSLSFTFELETLEPRIRPFEKLVRMAVQDGARRTVRKLKLLIEKEMLANG
ncbi:SRPBCC family protein [Accumulibacter sp.]|uniref:SRPBCC family protein n=1 Tax=Accumulibacter sp. TaxID=2053492 RepID=UPI001D3F906B|nr:SRPBCC family protein [Accumulibacter sp.]MCB1966338.1 SRPBCC family protein [Accumulibacter sp.]MCP5227071.1 SRPBCC family protein [Accumulibacter sp.]